MPIHNADIAATFNAIADILEIQGENPFRVRAYRNAARTIGELGKEISDLAKEGMDLTELPGIGRDLAAKIHEILETGRCSALERLRRQVPASVTELMRLPGLGPKRVKALWHDLGVQTAEQLDRAARDGRLRELAGFGPKTEQRILEAVGTHRDATARLKLAVAGQYASALVRFLRTIAGVREVMVAGSFRRMKETVGDLDILVTADDPSSVIAGFAGYDEVGEVLSKGRTRSTVVLKSGIQVDLRVVAPESYGAALHYFTGSKAHNIAIRRLGQERGLKINEYGVFRGKTRIAGDTEESVYRSVGLPLIPPELREDRGEIEAAKQGLLPKLVELDDLRGDLHAHTRASDGHNSLREMAVAARDRGFEYLAITEHSRHLTVTHGLDATRLLRQCEEIDRLNTEIRGITLLKGIEVDILEDGSLDLPDSVLARLDIIIGAIHSQFHLSQGKQTERIIRAMKHPYFNLLAHPSGRLLGSREPYDVDMLKIIRSARSLGCFLELNAHPERLDLLDTQCQMAREEGVLVAVNSDAHSVHDFDNLIYGVGQARRGWLEKTDILNTRTLHALRTLLKREAGMNNSKNS
ncbi:MAG: DNA polymerase/3'-5' exonuclease PolX [Gammaproteobacteria bacterium]|nr:DNA polymerase/3'-5' exonuclease PolX [Gammaproteobacteria bacterium]